MQIASNQMNEIVIDPYKSVGDFILGSSRKEIEKKFGKAVTSTENTIMNNVIELREAKELVYNKVGRVYLLDSVGCLKDTSPLICGVNAFEVGLEGLKALDSDYVEGDRYTTFRTLGVALGGFGKKKIAEKRIIIAFRRDSLENFEIFAQI